MENVQHRLGIYLIFVCIILATMAHKCVSGQNLTTPTCSKKERLALLKFKHSVIDDQGMLSSWGIGYDCCRWERVGCDHATGRVVSLYIGGHVGDDYYKLLLEDYAPIPLYEINYQLVYAEMNICLAKLVNLKYLDLSGIDFENSRIPEFIGSLKQLRYLNLSSAGFSGDIPHQIGNLSNLKVLDLNSYPGQLQTSDMAWISGLSKLQILDLSGVDLSRAKNLNSLLYTIPSLLKLRLSMCGCSLSHLGSHHLNSSRELASIKHLDLSGNDFKGQLPGLFLNMTSLEFLDLSFGNVSLAWSFNYFITTIPFVSELRLSDCNIHMINFSPKNLNYSTHSSIQNLDLSWNNIEGTFPSILINMSSLLFLDLSVNYLNSSIPFMPNLLKLDVSWNKFRETEDIGIWRHCNLKELIGSNNNLEGEMIGISTNVTKCTQNALEILYLDHTTLKCSIPESIGRLTSLRGLDLSFNELTGPIPEVLGKLRLLRRLCLSYNQLKSSIPTSLGSLTDLREIILNSNRFTGPIPVSLGKLTSLRVLLVSSNFLNGTIPNSIGQLSKLILLDISNNSLQGVVSGDHFANLSMLKYLVANSNNKLFFNISSEWIPPFQLKVARLGSCRIEDGFPQWFRTQRKLEELVLSNASIFGPLPTWLRLMPSIGALDLSLNKLTGSLTSLPFIVNFQYGIRGTLLLQNNLFKGLIPRSLCTMTHLNVLDLSKNRLSGKIPKCLWNLTLTVMSLSSNKLYGVLPSSLGHASLEWLQLNDNNFSGELPHDFGYFLNLLVLDLGENKISGNITRWIGENITRLTALRLHKNNFTGRIPHSLCKSRQLKILDLAHNDLTGSIPHCFGELNGMKDNWVYDSLLSSFRYGHMIQVYKGVALDYSNTLKFVINIDLSSNKLVGEIPEVLTTLDALVGLNLCNNCFTGSIPKNIGNMMSLDSLDLSANELSGMIPPSMAVLNFLSYLNLSHNNLSGQIPTGNQLQTLTDPLIYADNPYLCGAPLPKECSPHGNTKTTTSKNKYKNGNESKKVWFYLDITSGFAAGFWGIIGMLLVKKQWRHKLFMSSELAMDKIYVAVAIRVLKMKRARVAA